MPELRIQELQNRHTLHRPVVVIYTTNYEVTALEQVANESLRRYVGEALQAWPGDREASTGRG